MTKIPKLTGAEIPEVIAFLTEKKIPERFNLASWKKQSFARKCASYRVEGDSLYFLDADDGLRLKKVIGSDCEEEKKIVVMSIHNQSHRGRDGTYSIIHDSYTGISRSDVQAIIQQCLSCQKFEPLKKCDPIEAIKTQRPMERLQIDLVDLKEYKVENAGYKFIINSMDCFSKFAFTRAIKVKSAQTIVEFLRDLFYSEGPPEILHCDNGTEFANKEIKALCAEFNVRDVHGRVRHPQSQGQIERCNQTLTRMLAKKMHESGSMNTKWLEHLPHLTYMYNRTIHRSHRKTPFKAFRNRFGSNSIVASVSDEIDQEEVLDDDTDPFKDSYDSSVEQSLKILETTCSQTNEEIVASQVAYTNKWVKDASVHARKNELPEGSPVLIADDFDANTKTKKTKFKPFFSKSGVVKQKVNNNCYKIVVDDEISIVRRNQIKKLNAPGNKKISTLLTVPLTIWQDIDPLLLSRYGYDDPIYHSEFEADIEWLESFGPKCDAPGLASIWIEKLSSLKK
jgi:hypothetical protein